MINKTKILIKTHFGFILTAAVTYIIGLLLVWFQYTTSQAFINTTSSTQTISIDPDLFLNTLITTTITYVLGCTLVNITDLFNERNFNYYYNITTCFLVFIYLVIYCIYLISPKSIIWNIFEIILTIALLFFNIISYKERYDGNHIQKQYHDLV